MDLGFAGTGKSGRECLNVKRDPGIRQQGAHRRPSFVRPAFLPRNTGTISISALGLTSGMPP